MGNRSSGPGPMPQVCKPAMPNPPLKKMKYKEQEPDWPRESSYPRKIPIPVETRPTIPGFVFAKSCKLPDAVIDHANPIPVGNLEDYGSFALLGGREVDGEGSLLLKKISGDVPSTFGRLVLQGLSVRGASCAGRCAPLSVPVVTTGVTAGTFVGLVALLWPSSLGDSALYSEEQLRSLGKARSRVRLRIEEQPDGSLKGYGFNTQKNRDWEMLDVVQFNERRVADLGDGITLLWTPAVDSSSRIPALEAPPRAPLIWIFPPTEKAEQIIVNPIYPPEYKDFILVFPADSGVEPLYIVLNVRREPGVVTGTGEDVQGIWLAGAGEGSGSPIPTKIADTLRGMSFNSFDSFREMFWKSVASDAELASQFGHDNLERMLGGNAPIARNRDAMGKRKSFELHHVELVSEGGELYGIDNLRVVTPKNHIDIHR